MGVVSDVAERLWTGEVSVMTPSGIRVIETELQLEEYQPGVAFVAGYANAGLMRSHCRILKEAE